MRLECLLEEASAKEALRHLMPRIVGRSVDVGYYDHGGKPDLLDKLPGRLRGYARWARAADVRLLVLVVRDADDCHDLKARIERACADADLPTRTAPASDGGFVVVNRVAVEELEAWFIGDPDAVRAAYPKVPASFEHRSRYRDPDAVPGGTWEALERLLQKAGYYPAGLPKVEVAGSIAAHMAPDRNRSPSFRTFVDGVHAVTRTAVSASGDEGSDR